MNSVQNLKTCLDLWFTEVGQDSTGDFVSPRLQTVQEKRKRIQAELAAAIPPDTRHSTESKTQCDDSSSLRGAWVLLIVVEGLFGQTYGP